PDLLTLRAVQRLQAADVVVHDRLVSQAVLEHAPPTAERIDVGKTPGGGGATQADINALLVRLGREAKRVVRLKGGDPFVFGRGGEEAEALRAAGVAFEVVPGVTSALAAPAYAGIPVTHRGLARAVTIVTGHEDPTQEVAGVDWAALARAGGTLVILMGASRIDAIAAALRAGGLPGDTPVAAVQRGTRPDQATLRATLATIGDAAPAAPAAIVVGPVAALDLAWFEQRPLFGRTVVVTRAREQASGLRATLETLGAAVAELPAIVIEPLAVTLPDLSRFAWLVLTSANGVEALFAALRAAGRDARALAGVRVAVIGPGTAAALDAHGVRADLLPERFVAEALLDAFPAPSQPGEAVLVARAAQARDVLPDGLGARGYTVEVLPLYATRPAPPDDEVVAALRAGRVDAVTFTSSSTVTNFCDAVGPLEHPPLVVSIGPVTSATARERGLHVDAEASEHTIDGLVARLVETLTQ
ncbi:MAG TPA: uroporphyrinogen-III C-methyltransferase, partial [Acidimicrobiia bacterium]|nr:uroporphyrinogen-III C-methyltransferase [Acidimicrobiia bacterium]